MKIIDKPTEYFSQIWPKQPIEADTVYRPIKYLRKINSEDGTVVFNILSGEIILLEKGEENILCPTGNTSDETTKMLIEKWFLVPEGTKDFEISDKLTWLIENLNSIYTSPKISSFVILPTTDCNARCFYCYELGRSRINMSMDTAKDVLYYIMRKKSDGEIKLQWFGGEPLYNVKVIDFICTELEKKGVAFKSHMVSNGYLFDPEMIKRAKELWKLKKVQITIDGTKDVYNRVKAYIHKDCENPFERVLTNIEGLLNNEIQVHIRMNMDMHNIDDLYELSDYLTERFKGHNNYFMYPHLLYDSGKKVTANRDEDYLKSKYYELKSKLNRLDPRKPEYFSITHFKSRCMADTDTTVMILPEGQLGKCEHNTEDQFIGSIYDETLDLKKIREFKRLAPQLKKCDLCDMRPACIHLTCCPNHKNESCNELDKQIKEQNLDMLVMKVYNFKTKNQQEGK